ncbi:MAG: YidC/Oxa1 family membrane protein insertase [Lachnospiraceae bacterium]|nr:YidC/Oxa1 family membrane protein insertase [Lachnospiraceae bacterium]
MLDLVFLTKEDGLLMGPISRVLGWILNGIYEFLALFTDNVNGIGIANIALCIILFTIIVKMLMLPLTIKQQKSTKLSAQMSPELTAINEKYKGKTDEASRRKMQMETQAIYDKYGTNPMVGCLTLLISLPILFALYRVIYAIPAYINDVYDMYKLAANAIQGVEGYAETLANFVKDASLAGVPVEKFVGYDVGVLTEKNVIDVLSKCNEDTWATLFAAFPSISTQLKQYSEPIIHVHKFIGGLNVLNNPVMNGNYLSIGVLVPILSAALQFLQSKLTTASNKKDGKEEPAMAGMKSMNIFLPIMSGFICFMMPIGAGLYWIISSLVQIVQQIFINRYMDKITVEELIEKNQAKRAKKLKKMGIDSGNKMAQVAKTSTKSIEVEEIKSTKDYANLSGKKYDTDSTSANGAEESTNEEKTEVPVSGSISSYANILKNRNQK